MFLFFLNYLVNLACCQDLLVIFKIFFRTTCFRAFNRNNLTLLIHVSHFARQTLQVYTSNLIWYVGKSSPLIFSAVTFRQLEFRARRWTESLRYFTWVLSTLDLVKSINKVSSKNPKELFIMGTSPHHFFISKLLGSHQFFLRTFDCLLLSHVGWLALNQSSFLACYYGCLLTP